MTWYLGLKTDGPHESEVQQDGRIVSRYSRVYKVQTDALTVPTESAIITALGIYPGGPYANDANATCHKTSITRLQTRVPWLTYDVACEWSTAAMLPAADSSDPTTRRTIWGVEPNNETRYITQNSDDTIIVNSAGQPPDGGVPIAFRLGTVTATRNITAVGYNKNTTLANSGKINSVIYLGAAIGTVQVDISAQEVYEGGYHYWSETYKFAYDPKGWQPQFINAGFFQRSAVGSNVLVRIQEGSPLVAVLEPSPLDKDGILVPVANRGTTDNTTSGKCSYTKLSYYGTMDFNTFGL